ncbi:zinc ribbon domain-containing protein [Candidatus Saccharibacteria bacterium]|nr:zinc ribbon domain-containing protein [Candidatus Saccharibacteria bacterium]
MSIFDKMMDRNMERAKKMQKKMLDMQEEIYNENGEQIERVNKKSAELGASGTKVHYGAVASGIKEGLSDVPEKYCSECGEKISVTAKYCSECGAKQK